MAERFVGSMGRISWLFGLRSELPSYKSYRLAGSLRCFHAVDEGRVRQELWPFRFVPIVGTGQQDFKRGSTSRHAVDVDGATQAANDPLNSRQSKPAPQRFRGVKGVENPGTYILGNATSGISHLQAHMSAS